MTDRVTRKAFKNGGSVAVRIPKGWLDEDAEIEIVKREDGIVEIRPLDRASGMKLLLEGIIARGPIAEDVFPIRPRVREPERFNLGDLWIGKIP